MTTCTAWYLHADCQRQPCRTKINIHGRGSVSALKGEKNINTEFTYDNMGVGKFKTEAEYVAKKTDEYNKKEPGKGDKWAQDWVADQNRKL